MAYPFKGYWKDVGTLGSYWEANMELINLIPEFNLYEEYWKTYTKASGFEPAYFGPDSKVSRSIVGEGSEIDGIIKNSVLGPGVVVEKGAQVCDSIIMANTRIGAGTELYKSIVAEGTVIGENVKIGVGEEAPNELNASVYSFGLATIGKDSVIPDGVTIGKNTAISGVTIREDYPNGVLESGETLIKAGDLA